MMCFFCFFKQQTAYEMRISDWSSDVCSSDLAEDLMEDMQAGNLDYGRVIATPDMMGVVGRLGKLLGPKGLMPNPKLGTVTPNIAEAVKAAKGGQIEFRVEKEIGRAPV